MIKFFIFVESFELSDDCLTMLEMGLVVELTGRVAIASVIELSSDLTNLKDILYLYFNFTQPSLFITRNSIVANTLYVNCIYLLLLSTVKHNGGVKSIT